MFYKNLAIAKRYKSSGTKTPYMKGSSSSNGPGLAKLVETLSPRHDGHRYLSDHAIVR